MRIGVAQLKSESGEIPTNLFRHSQLIDLAASVNVNGLFFPELSLTGYEPTLASKLALSDDDTILDILQDWSDFYSMTLGVGIPTKSHSGVRISMLLFQPNRPRMIYSKQMLHEDELPYFEKGDHQVILEIKSIKVAPAICYESLQINHAEKARSLGAKIYVASVAKALPGVNKAFSYFPEVAKNFNMPVLMANSIGYCDNFESAGKSAIWDKQGMTIGQLDQDQEGILLYDTVTEEVIIQIISL